jgi:hypothetical protein
MCNQLCSNIYAGALTLEKIFRICFVECIVFLPNTLFGHITLWWYYPSYLKSFARSQETVFGAFCGTASLSNKISLKSNYLSWHEGSTHKQTVAIVKACCTLWYWLRCCHRTGWCEAQEGDEDTQSRDGELHDDCVKERLWFWSRSDSVDANFNTVIEQYLYFISIVLQYMKVRIFRCFEPIKKTKIHWPPHWSYWPWTNNWSKSWYRFDHGFQTFYP